MWPVGQNRSGRKTLAEFSRGSPCENQAGQAVRPKENDLLAVIKSSVATQRVPRHAEAKNASLPIVCQRFARPGRKRTRRTVLRRFCWRFHWILWRQRGSSYRVRVLKFWILLFVAWVLFLFGVVPALMDGNRLPLVVWAIAGTPVWLIAVFALNHASARTALGCFSLCCILSIASIAAYCKLRYDQASNRLQIIASRPAQPRPPNPAQPAARRPARARHNLSGSGWPGQHSDFHDSKTQGTSPTPLEAAANSKTL
jgi:hypothetical protein